MMVVIGSALPVEEAPRAAGGDWGLFRGVPLVPLGRGRGLPPGEGGQPLLLVEGITQVPRPLQGDVILEV